jgi:hypothetical protein
MTIKPIRKVVETRYGNVEAFFLGKWKVAEVYYNSSRSQTDPLCYRAIAFLPGLKSPIGDFEKIEQAIEAADKAIHCWLTEARCKENV